MNARVYDLGPRLAERRATDEAARRAKRSTVRRHADTVLDVLFAAGLAWSAWLVHGRRR